MTRRSAIGRSSRSLRSELFVLFLAFALPLALFLSFPREAIGFVPSPRSDSSVRSAFAFVTLTQERESKVLSDARAAWQVLPGRTRGMWFDLLKDAIPEAAPVAVVDFSRRTRPVRGGAVPFVTTDFPATCAAAPLSKLPSVAEVAKPTPAFSRDEMLIFK